MKKNLFALFIALVLTISATAQKTTLKESEKTEILQTIQSESEAFYSRNFTAWQSKFAANPSWTCVEENGFVLEAYTRKDLEKLVGDYMKANSKPEAVAIERKNVLFIADVNSVWVNFDEYQTSGGKTKVLKGVRLMTKSGGRWLISGLHSSFVKYQ